MNTQTHLPESADSVCMAYGHEVEELLSMCSAETWIEDLWAIFTGYMLSETEMGYNPRLADIFTSFRDLVMFFEKVKTMREMA